MGGNADYLTVQPFKGESLTFFDIVGGDEGAGARLFPSFVACLGGEQPPNCPFCVSKAASGDQQGLFKDVSDEPTKRLGAIR